MFNMALEASGTSVTSAVTDLLAVGTSALNWITSNPFLSLLFAGCIIPVAFKVIKAAKKAAK